MPVVSDEMGTQDQGQRLPWAGVGGCVCPGSTDLGSSQLPHLEPVAGVLVWSYRSQNQCDGSEEKARDSGHLIS